MIDQPLEIALPAFPERTVVEFAHERVSYRDLAAVAILADEWSPFMQRCSAGADLAEHEQADEIELRRAAEVFRRERHLEAGSDLRGWLDERQLSMDEWRAALERSVLRSQVASDA